MEHWYQGKQNKIIGRVQRKMKEKLKKNEKKYRR
jgi:hypothetical protein